MDLVYFSHLYPSLFHFHLLFIGFLKEANACEERVWFALCTRQGICVFWFFHPWLGKNYSEEQLIPWIKDLGGELKHGGGEKHNHVELRWAHIFLNQTELRIPVPAVLHGDIRCQMKSILFTLTKLPSLHFFQLLRFVSFFTMNDKRWPISQSQTHAWIPCNFITIKMACALIDSKTFCSWKDWYILNCHSKHQFVFIFNVVSGVRDDDFYCHY